MVPLNLLQSSPEYLLLCTALSSCHFKEDSVFFKNTELQSLETRIYADVNLAHTIGCPPAKAELAFWGPDVAYVQMWEHMPCVCGASLGAEI